MGELTNLKISTDYSAIEVWLMRKDFTAMFAYCVVELSPYEVPDIRVALAEFNDYVTLLMGGETCKKFEYEKLHEFISEQVLENIPAVLDLNEPKVNFGPGYMNRHKVPHPDYDFIDLGALARNIFYGMVREQITTGDIEPKAA